MTAKPCFLFLLSGLLLIGAIGSRACAQFAPLLQRVPHSANTIFLFNAEKTFSSAVAQKEDWQKNFANSIEKGLVHLPVDTTHFVMAGHIDFDSMHPVWQVGAVKTKNKHDMVVIAKKSGGTRDTIGGHEAVLLPGGTYVVQCDPFTYATMAPAGRQAVARWMSETESAAPRFTPYLQEAIGYAEDSGTELIMAIELTDGFDPTVVKTRVEESSLVAEKKLEAAEVTAVLLSIKGLMLGVTLGEKPYGSIKVDFGRDARVLKGSAKQILLDGLANRGVMVDDLQSWNETVEGSTITFSGYLTTTGLRQITSLLDAPVAAAVATDEPAAQTSTSPSDEDPAAVASQKYFDSVNQFFSDLRDKEPQRIAQYGGWFEKYARKIDQLPMVNVDSEMLDYGAYVAQQLRNAAAAIQGIGIRSRVRQVDAAQQAGGVTPAYYGSAYDGGYAYGGNYYYGANAFARGNYVQEGLRQQQMARTQVKVQEKAVGTSAARAIVQDIEQATAMVRRQMTEKYKVEF